MDCIRVANKQVYDFRRRCFTPIIDEQALRAKIDWHFRMQWLNETWSRTSLRYWVYAAIAVVLALIYVQVSGGKGRNR
jgi:hypothetical protein